MFRHLQSEGACERAVSRDQSQPALCQWEFRRAASGLHAAMLLHRWLLLHKNAGGEEQRLKHLKVMVSGVLCGIPVSVVALSSSQFQMA